ncbi:DUF4357 domain-containing protein [Patulibacter americanus]|uniref:DUF4357 domain-containing protein n=1 Tax=Patulibacter americanus TaxID=588672 RepID=UPI0003B75A82|nr:DUF4357 domain-containing protein [Patulibacter americanus]
MADLLITASGPGVARVSSVDPFDTLRVFRIHRDAWQATPDEPGVYLLYGVAAGDQLTAYVGMSTTSMLKRIRTHHVTPAKNWFGVIFAVPVPSPLLCPAIEAELIGEMQAANVVSVIANVAEETRHRGLDDVHIDPALEKIRSALELLLGQDVFTAAETDGEPPAKLDAPLTRLTPLSRENRSTAAEATTRDESDPVEATHRYVGAAGPGWGRFKGPEPAKEFIVLAGSGWRAPKLDPDQTTYPRQKRVAGLQQELLEAGVLDASDGVFTRDHEFSNWNYATQVVSGKAQYSGAYHWQPLPT